MADAVCQHNGVTASRDRIISDIKELQELKSDRQAAERISSILPDSIFHNFVSQSLFIVTGKCDGTICCPINVNY